MQAPHEVCSQYARTLIRVKARQLIRQPGFSRSDQDDIEQDLLLHLLGQVEHFDPTRGSFNTFVARVVDSAVAMLVRERRRQKRTPAGDAILQSLEVMVDEPDGPPSPLWSIIGTPDLDRRTGAETRSAESIREQTEAIEHAIRTLPPDLRQICQSLRDRNRTDTARELGLSPTIKWKRCSAPSAPAWWVRCAPSPLPDGIAHAHRAIARIWARWHIQATVL